MRFGIARVHSVPIVRFSELCKLVARLVDIPFTAADYATYVDLGRAVTSGEVSVAWVPPITAAELCERKLAEALALPFRGGQLTYHTAFVMKRGMEKPLDKLRGARVAWVDANSASGYHVPRVHLASLGLDPTTHFRQEIFAGSHVGVIDAVVSGRVDVGATYVNLDSRTQRVVAAAWTASDGTPVRPIEIVASAGPIPNDAIVAAKELGGVDRARFMRFLLDPPVEAKPLLREVFNTTDFRLAKDGHFVPLRHMLRAAGARSGIRTSPVSEPESKRGVR